MAVSIVMPALEMAQETGKIISWLKKEGDSIAKGEPIAEIETDKVVLELEASADGVLAGVKAAAGDVVQVGKTIAWIVAPGEKPPVEADQCSSRGANHDGRKSKQAAAASAAAAPASARKSGSQGFAQSAPHGAGTRRGFEQGSWDRPRRRPSAEKTFNGQPIGQSSASLRRLRRSTAPRSSSIARLMAERTTQSWTTAPHFFLVREIDASGLDRRARETWQSDHSYRSSRCDWSRARW